MYWVRGAVSVSYNKLTIFLWLTYTFTCTRHIKTEIFLKFLMLLYNFRFVMQELFDTEKDYVKDLGLIIEVCIECKK